MTYTWTFSALVLLLSQLGCSQSQSAQTKQKAPAAVKTVQTEAVRHELMHRDIEVVGTLAAQEEVTVSSQSDGIVLRVLADLGDVVKANQPLVELDPEKLRYNLDQQKATLTRALTKYGAATAGNLPAEKDTPDVRRAEAELAQARVARQRAQELSKSKLIAQQALDDAESLYQTKQASYDLAMQNARNLKADIDVADASTKLAERQLRDAYIRAPFDAYVQKRMVSVGQLVSPQTQVMALVKVGPLKITAEIPERMAPWVKVGQSVEFQAEAFPGKTFRATVSRISPAVNAQTRSFSFEAIAANQDSTLKPGTFARVHVATALTEEALTIPYRAVQYRFGVSRAFVVNGDSLAVREVKLGARHDERVEIAEGLKQGDSVALTDVDNLAEGMKVNVSGGAN